MYLCTTPPSWHVKILLGTWSEDTLLFCSAEPSYYTALYYLLLLPFKPHYTSLPSPDVFNVLQWLALLFEWTWKLWLFWSRLNPFIHTAVVFFFTQTIQVLFKHYFWLASHSSKPGLYWLSKFSSRASNFGSIARFSALAVESITEATTTASKMTAFFSGTPVTQWRLTKI